MHINRLTEKAQEAVVAAQQLAEREGHPQIEPEHLLLTLIEQHDGVVPALLQKLAVDAAALAAATRAALDRPAFDDRRRTPVALGPPPGRADRREQRGGAADRRVRQHRAPVPGRGGRARRRAGGPPAVRARGRQGSALRGADRGPRLPPGDRRASRREVPGARTLRPRPDRAGPRRRARPGHRPGRRDPAGHPGALAPNQEQPGPHR